MVTSKSGQVLMEFCHIQTTMAMMLQFIFIWMGRKDISLLQNSTGKSSWMKQRMRQLLLLDLMILTLMMFILMKPFVLQSATRSQGMYSCVPDSHRATFIDLENVITRLPPY